VSFQSTLPMICPSYGLCVSENVVFPQGSDGAGNLPRDRHCRRAERRRVDPVVDEPPAQVDGAAAVARRRRKLREVTGAHRRGRNGCVLIEELISAIAVEGE